MKHLIFAFLAFLCVQGIHATPRDNKCENVLPTLRNEAATFFAKLTLKLEVAHQNLKAIKDASFLLETSLDTFAAENFGSEFNQSQLQCILKQFLDIFSVEWKQAADRLLDLQEVCDKLLCDADDFSLVFCKPGTFTGCESQLNQLRCKLSDYFEIFETAGPQIGKSEKQGGNRGKKPVNLTEFDGGNGQFLFCWNTPSYFIGDRYYNSYRYYRPLYISPTSYARTRAYLPYIPSTDYKYSRYSSLDRLAPLARMMSPIYPEGIRYDYTYGMDFNSATQDIRFSANKLLQDIQTPSTRYTRASSLEPTYNSDLDYYNTRRAVSRARMMSEEPITRRITTTRCYYY